jgi:transcriptional regulator with XRE-family HTH domain
MTENTRRMRLELLIDEYDGQENLAAALDVTQSYISQLRRGYRPINEKTARKWEVLLKKPNGWMDAGDSVAFAECNALLQEIAERDPKEIRRIVQMIRAYLSE